MFNLIGKTLGQYRILEQVGVGGMATVYKAYQPSMDRYVAIKVLPPYLSQDDQFVKRFQREAHAIARLEHAHILPVYDYGESEGVTYIVMRYVSAGTLKEFLAKGRLSYEEMARIVNQISSALDYAHRQGVIHRDVKPNNILVDEQGNTYLTDFGLARMLETTQQITGSGVGVGTPAYMSPEQGKGIKADHRSDIYSLGVILYEMVTGHVPFEAETPMAVVLKHITDPLPLPRAILPEVPEQVEMVILRALAKDPAHRYQSAGEMAQALNASVRKVAPIESPTSERLAPEPWPVSAGPISILTKVGRLWQKPRGRLALLGIGVIVVALLGLLLSLLPGRVAIVASETLPKPTETVVTTISSIGGEVASATPLVAKATLTQFPIIVPSAPQSTNTALPKTVTSSNLRWEQVYDASLIPIAINALAIDPTNPENVFAGTYGAGIYISHDGGKTWNPSNTGLGKGTVGQLVVHPLDSKTVYAALFDQGGIYKSTDGGQTWKGINAGINLDQAWVWTGLVYIAPNDTEKIYFADTYSGLYRSTNGGSSWSLRSRDCPRIAGLVIDPADSDHLYASSYNHSDDTCISGAYESLDAGYNWKLLTTPEMRHAPDERGGDWWHIAVDPQDFQTLYAGGQLGTYKSSDGGKTWVKTLGSCQWLTVNPYSGEVYCGDGKQVQISGDGGQNWVASGINAQLSNQERLPITFAPDGRTIYVGNDQLSKSTNGGRSWDKLDWSALARGRLTVDPSGNGRLFFSAIDNPGQVYLSRDGGKKWQLVLKNVSAGSRIAFHPELGAIYPSSEHNEEALYRSQNGMDWEKFATGLPTFGARQVVPDPQNLKKFWLVGECSTTLMVSEDDGQTFAPAKGFVDELCQPTIVADQTGQRVYVIGGAFYRTEDGGVNWVNKNKPGGDFRAALIDPSNPDVVYIGSTHNGLLKTINGGDSWNKLDGLPAASINDLAIDPLNPAAVYAATDSGLYISTDAGASWAIIDKGLGANPIVYSVVVDLLDPTKVYIVTPDGVFQLAY